MSARPPYLRSSVGSKRSMMGQTLLFRRPLRPAAPSEPEAKPGDRQGSDQPERPCRQGTSRLLGVLLFQFHLFRAEYAVLDLDAVGRRWNILGVYRGGRLRRR